MIPPWLGNPCTRVVVLAAFLLAPTGADGQTMEDREARVLDFDPCAGCAIKLSEDVVLELTDPISLLTRLDDGRLVAWMDYDPGRMTILAPDGTVSGHVGRRGEGPGEYEFIAYVFNVAGRAHVMDGIRRRLTVLDDDFEALATIQLPGPMTGFSLANWGDSAYVAPMTLYTPDRIGYALHLFDKSGQALRSFDEPPGGWVQGQNGDKFNRKVVAARDGSLYAVHRSKYQIDSWDPNTGRRLWTLRREADWFPDHDEVGWQPLDPQKPRLPIIVGFEQDSAGYLWVVMGVATDRWAEGLVKNPEGPDSEMGEYTFPDDVALILDVVVEVIDPVNGRVVAAARFDEWFWAINGRWMGSSDEVSAFEWRHQLWRLSLQMPQGIDAKGG